MSFELDFTGVEESGNIYRSIPESGLYRVRVVSVTQRVTNAGNDRIDFNLVVDSGKHQGCSVRTGLNVVKREQCRDAGDYRYRMSFWKTALTSFGVTKLNGPVKTNLSLLDYCKKNCEGKVGYMKFELGEPYPEKELLTPQQYEILLEVQPAPSAREAVVERLSEETAAEETTSGEDPLDFIPF